MRFRSSLAETVTLIHKLNLVSEETVQDSESLLYEEPFPVTLMDLSAPCKSESARRKSTYRLSHSHVVLNNSTAAIGSHVALNAIPTLALSTPI